MVFTALPNGDAQKISKVLNKNNVLIDLAADFRLENKFSYLKWYKQKHKASNNIKKSIYSLPEINGKLVDKYNIISCPGCYPTSILLPLIPLIKSKLIDLDNIIIDSKSGFSGAGRSVHQKYKDKNLYESLSAYAVGFHRHNSEIEQELNYYTGKKVKFSFTPHLSPMFRGILTTIYVDLKGKSSINKINSKLKNFYKDDFFIKIKPINKFISTNDVINTNSSWVSVDDMWDNLIVSSIAFDPNYSNIIYELGKGAKHSLISPKLATEYLTTNGRSFSKCISILLHRLVHLMK